LVVVWCVGGVCVCGGGLVGVGGWVCCGVCVVCVCVCVCVNGLLISPGRWRFIAEI